MEIYVDFSNKEILVGLEETKQYCLESIYIDFYEWLNDTISAEEIWNFNEEDKENTLIQFIKEYFGYRKID